VFSKLAVVDDVVEAVTERDTSEAVAAFALVEVVASSETTGLVDDTSDELGVELVILAEAGASELTATLDATELAGSTDVAATVSVAAGATVVVETLSGAVIGEVAVGTPSP